MIRVGLVGEDPNDTSSLKILLNKKYSGRVHFQPLLKRIRGHQLDSVKTKRAVGAEMSLNKCSFILFIRDLDGLHTQKDLVQLKNEWFSSLNQVCGNQNIFLLNIWELEAMIFGDIETFNSKYGTAIRADKNPMMISNPKEELKRATYKGRKRFEESHCPEIFEALDFDRVVSRCDFFRDFIIQFERRLEIKSK